MTQPRELPEVNYLLFSGIVTQKQDMKWSSFGKYVIRFSVENTLTRQDVPGGRKSVYQIQTEAWGELAEEVERNIPRGAAVIIEGTLVSRVFVDTKKEEHHKMLVKASSVSLLDTRA